jgi:hypothetical protein
MASLVCALVMSLIAAAAFPQRRAALTLIGLEAAG